VPNARNVVPTGTALVAELALRLHRQDCVGLSIELPPSACLTAAELPDGCQLVADDTLLFESLQARNVIVANSAFVGLLSASVIDTDALFALARKLWRHEIGHNDQASGRLLALASTYTDVLAISAQRIRSGSNVFDVLHLVEAALPYLQRVEVSSVIDLFVAKYEHTKNDIAGGAIHAALESWLETREMDAQALHASVLVNLSEATALLLGNAVCALSKSNYAIATEIARADAQSETSIRARIGVWSLGRLLLNEQAPEFSIDVVIQAVLELIEHEQDELRLQAIQAAVGAMHVIAAFDPILKRLAEGGDQDVLSAVTAALFLKSKELHERGTIKLWLELMHSLKPEFKGAIRNLDHAMSRLLSDPANATMVASMLEKWVAKHGHRVAIDSDTARLFDDTVRKLVSVKASWASLVTDWLLSDAQEHPAALAGFLTQLSHHSGIELSLDKERLDGLTTEDLLFLARRLLGYVHDRAQLTALALSMLQSNQTEQRIYPVLRALLVDEIGYDYPGSTASACRGACETMSTSSHKEFLLTVAETIERIADTQSSLPMLNELRPPTKLRRLFARARAKQMDESFEEASQNSIWRQIATQINIKAGQSTFSYQDASYGPSMHLSSMSHTVELPRREAYDPIGNAIRHFGFRLATRDES
jgi:hypothetical protein